LFEGADASLVGDLSTAASSGPAEAEAEDSAAADADVVSART
jgi:hypothetical protein